MRLHSLIFIILVSLPGCASWYIPAEAKTEAQKNADRLNAYVMWMNAGKTTREQDQAIIRAIRRYSHTMNYILNDVPLPPDVEAWNNYYDLMGQSPPETQSIPVPVAPPAPPQSPGIPIQPLQPPPIDWSSPPR